MFPRLHKRWYTFTRPCSHEAVSVMLYTCVSVCVCVALKAPVVLQCLTSREQCWLSVYSLTGAVISVCLQSVTISSDFNDRRCCSSPCNRLRLLLTTHSALLTQPPSAPHPSELFCVPALPCPLCQPSIREGYEGSALPRGSSPRWILRLLPRPLMVKGEPAGSQMDPLQAGRHTDWLSLKKHHLCVPTGGGCN